MLALEHRQTSRFGLYDRDDLIQYALHLEREIGVANETTKRVHTRNLLGLSPHAFGVAMALHRARDRFLSKAQILEAIASNASDEHALTVFITAVRRVLGYQAIETDRGYGYRLTPEGRAMIDAARTREEAA